MSLDNAVPPGQLLGAWSRIGTSKDYVTRGMHRITSISRDLTKSEFPCCDPFRNDDTVEIEVYVSVVLKKPLHIYFEGNKFKH